MILLKFLKQQNWWYLTPCIVFLCLFQYVSINLAWSLSFATAFLILYSLKFADKQNNLLIDQLKLMFYFLYFTSVLLFTDSYAGEVIIQSLFYFCLFFLYFYTLLLFYKKETEEKGDSIKGFYWGSVFIVQTILMLLAGVWAITQKVEADKQKGLAQIERQKMIKAQLDAENTKLELQKYKNQYDKK